jgi:hypothetical protein
MIALCLLAANGAFAYDSICSPATDTFSSFVCADPFLKVSTKKMEGALSKILTTLPKQVAIDFQSSEREWLFGIGSRDCGLTDPRDPFQRNAARDCLRMKFEDHQGRLAMLSSGSERPAYRLSPLETLIVNNYAEVRGDLAQIFFSPTMDRALDRLLRAVISTKADIADFQRGISGPGNAVEVTDGKFVYGERCMRHACSSIQSAFIADIKLGDIIFAVNQPGTRMMIFQKSCTSDSLKRFAFKRFQAPWVAAAADNLESGTPVEVKTNDCH